MEPTLKNLLEGTVPEVALGLDQPIDSENQGSEKRQRTSAGLCVECEDTPASVSCEECKDVYCELCYKAQHRKGSRQSHHPTNIGSAKSVPTAPASQKESAATEDAADADTDMEIDEEPTARQYEEQGIMEQRAKYIPIRLSLSERKTLRLLEAALHLQEMCSILCGLVVATDYKVGQSLIESKEFKDNAEFFQSVFEIGRRHKIMNPEKMRTEYGKLIYLCMDSVIPEIERLMGFSCVRPVHTVYTILKERNGIQLLADPLIYTATAEVKAERTKSRQQIQREIKQKEAAQEILSRKYANAELSSEQIKQCLYSISDNNRYPLRLSFPPFP